MKIKKDSYCDKKLREFVNSDNFRLICLNGTQFIHSVDFRGHMIGDEGFRIELRTLGGRSPAYKILKGQEAAKRLIEFYEQYLQDELDAEGIARQQACDDWRASQKPIEEVKTKIHALKSELEDLEQERKVLDERCYLAEDVRQKAEDKLKEFKASILKDTLPDKPKVVQRWKSIQAQPRDLWSWDRELIVEVMDDGKVACIIKAINHFPGHEDTREVLTGSKADRDYAMEHVKVMARDLGLTLNPYEGFESETITEETSEGSDSGSTPRSAKTLWSPKLTSFNSSMIWGSSF